jgi:dCTP deaminase
LAILSDTDILAALKSGDLRIEPLTETSLSSAGYDLRCGLAAEVQAKGHSLIHTLERVELCPSLCGQLFIRSSFAREGLFGSFALVDPGFRGQLTLCIANFGEKPVTIGEGERVAQLVFHRLASLSSKPYAGRYQDSTGIIKSRRKF